MMVKRFTGRTAGEALNRAKWELGPDAVVLSSARARDRWWKWWESGYQVLVAVDQADAPRTEVSFPRTEAAATAAPPAPEGVEIARQLERIAERLDGLQDGLGRQARAGGEAEAVYRWLCRQGLEDGWARDLVDARADDGPDPRPLKDRVLEELRERLAVDPDIPATVPVRLCFVGPTGAGKTTTIAKLAAHYRLNQGRRVALITTDTFRVAAVEQLRSYADIIGVPCLVALRPQELPGLVASAQADVILVDTPGHSVNHAMHMAQTRRTIELAGTTEVMVVLPATTQPPLMVEMAVKLTQGYRARVCLTKADEAHGGGAVLSALLQLGLPTTYVTNGQVVPDDIQVASREALVKWMERGEYRV